MSLALVALSVVLASAAPTGPQRPDILFEGFEGADYGKWVVKGEAFGPGPAQGTFPGQMPVSGFRGHGFVNGYIKQDGAKGSLTSPDLKVERKYISFLLGGGMDPQRLRVDLLVGGKVVRTATGPNDRPGGTEALAWFCWDVRKLAGKTAVIQIVDDATGGWGHINVDEITLSDEPAATPSTAGPAPRKREPLYKESLRPQFHFTPATGWTNDPNGMVYYKGEYHLFFQHNPYATEWGNMTWGHAVSKDMVHWQQIANAIEPDEKGTIFSGSAVIDWTNSSGFATGEEKPLVAVYTAAGDTSPASKGQPFTQCIAYSCDKGRTWTKYAGNPVLKHIIGGNRDPKVVRHEATKQWIMALYLDGIDYALFASPDLKEWKEIQKLAMEGCGECPDFFPMPVQGEPGAAKWVFTAANGRYYVGSFDGSKFTPETGPHIADHGTNYYAVQTFSDIPSDDGRRIQIAWMNGGSYPAMPFNQQMSFPCEMTLHRTAEGLRIRRNPVKEIASLYGKGQDLRLQPVKPGQDVTVATRSALLDIDAEIEVGDASEVTLRFPGESVVWKAAEKTLTVLQKPCPLEAIDGRIRVRVLLDRTSLEVFGNDGRLSVTNCFLPKPTTSGVAVSATGGTARIVSLKVREMKSGWQGAVPPPSPKPQ